MAFKGEIYSIRSKILCYNRYCTLITYGVILTHEDDKDMGIKVNGLQNTCSTISRALRRKAHKKTLIRLYKIMSEVTIPSGLEYWVP